MVFIAKQNYMFRPIEAIFHKNQISGAYAREHIAKTPEADQPPPGTRISEE